MLQKYTPAKPTRIYTNDLYFAALLLDKGHTPEIIRNDRRRITFAFSLCSQVVRIREAYRSGENVVDIRSFQHSLKHIRRLMDEAMAAEQRSDPCPEAAAVPTRSLVERFPMQLSQA